MGLLSIHGLGSPLIGPIDFQVAPGQCLGLTGPSGAGKTLLLRSLADLDEHGGRVALDGRAAEDFTPTAWRRAVGYLPAESAWWAATVGEHFADPGAFDFAPYGFEPGVAGWAIDRLSTGERQRLALARLLEGRPRALLLDEPTAALDPGNVARVEAILADYRRESGAPAVWVSHGEEQLDRVADVRRRMSGGKMLAEAD